MPLQCSLHSLQPGAHNLPRLQRLPSSAEPPSRRRFRLTIFPARILTPFSLGTIATVNGVTYTASMGDAIVTNSFLTTTSPNGLGSTSFGFFGPNETLTITFSSAITAFALDINTFATNSGDYAATVNDGSDSVVPSLLDVFPNQETGQFIGFTDSSPFTSVIISPVSDPGTGGGRCGDSSTCPYTVDTLVYGDAAALVPEPSVWAMMLTGFAGLGAVALRRRRKIIPA